MTGPTNSYDRRSFGSVRRRTSQSLNSPTKDYNENGLSELLALYGSAYNANIKIFNDLQHTITGWPGGKPNADDSNRPERALPYPKRVVVFSPHPDDDVDSIGGTIRRLVQQNHDVHVVYETSGNIAVGDEEVTRFMHFINGFNQLFDHNKDEVIKDKYQEIKHFLATKKDGDIDTRDILTIKGLIRRGEARTASTYNQIPLDHVHFLDLPFYESGRVEKFPMTEKDMWKSSATCYARCNLIRSMWLATWRIPTAPIASVRMQSWLLSTWRNRRELPGSKNAASGCIVAPGRNGRSKISRCVSR